jgi:hypothetical protein
MTIDSNYEVATSDELDLNDDNSSREFENSVADFDLNTDPLKEKSAKHNSKRNYEAQKKIEQLKEERRLKKLINDDYDDWD